MWLSLHDEGNTELELLIFMVHQHCVYGIIIMEVLSMNVLWKSIDGYEGLYEVSNKGNIRSMERMVVDKNGSTKPVHAKMLTWHKSK